MGRHISALKTQIFTPYKFFMLLFVFGAKLTTGNHGKYIDIIVTTRSLDTVFSGFWLPEVAFGAKYCVLKAVEA